MRFCFCFALLRVLDAALVVADVCGIYGFDCWTYSVKIIFIVHTYTSLWPSTIPKKSICYETLLNNMYKVLYMRIPTIHFMNT